MENTNNIPASIRVYVQADCSRTGYEQRRFFTEVGWSSKKCDACRPVDVAVFRGGVFTLVFTTGVADCEFGITVRVKLCHIFRRQLSWKGYSVKKRFPERVRTLLACARIKTAVILHCHCQEKPKWTSGASPKLCLTPCPIIRHGSGESRVVTWAVLVPIPLRATGIRNEVHRCAAVLIRGDPAWNVAQLEHPPSSSRRVGPVEKL